MTYGNGSGCTFKVVARPARAPSCVVDFILATASRATTGGGWFVIAGSSVEAFKGAAQEAAFGDLRELTKRVSESKVDKKSLASAINVKMPLNCIACTQPLLSADDPQFEEKVRELARVCHGGDLEPCSCRD